MFPPTHLIPSHLNSQTREWAFHSLHQNSQTREWENILKWFFSFLSIPFISPKRGLSQLRVTKVNIFKKFGKENRKITSHRLNVRIPKRKGEKRSFLFVHFVHLNGHPIADLTLKISDKNNRCLLKMVKPKPWLKNMENK